MDFNGGGSEPGGLSSALSAAALLNGALLAHEAGHLAAARVLGVAVREFSVGIGPRVAWWQGATTTYSLRALPLFGYVSFLTTANLAAATAAAAAPAGGHQAQWWRRPAAAGRGGAVLLEALSPGRRAIVVAAGVAANALLAAAFVGYQVLSYGELGLVVRPGARVRAVDGWEDDGGGGAPAAATAAAVTSSPGAAPSGRLRAGDVVLRVGERWLPAGGDLDAAFVAALEEAASGAPSLEGVKITVLRRRDCSGGATAVPGGGGAASTAHGCTCGGTCSGGGSGEHGGSGTTAATSSSAATAPSSSSSAGSPWEVLTTDAADVLRYETFVVGPNAAAGYRRPQDAMEAAAMTGRELASWTAVVLGCWAEAFTAATASCASAAGLAMPARQGRQSDGGSGFAAASDAQMVGPLGVVASAAAAVVAAERESRAQSCIEATAAAAVAAATGGSGAGGVAAVAAPPCGEVSPREPSPLLGLGIQLNLQLAAVNLLPVPVLDGGQLLLLAFTAARGGKRLPPGLERGALALSGLAVAGWIAALSLADMVSLADKAAAKLTVALSPPDRPAGRGAPLPLAAAAVGEEARGAEWDTALAAA
ncbi:hypothetical protein GPECTOR_15g363 [Gonium pectorale]|uniref:Peptidase M50 domain-containing protein n=1 Tax=Gonium pectorale TaxID=33097 RepID=A0A150GLE9_GONPE|nr:hypothetical protein GPECTOR_15g363 [Gonium pectorale]|eukprot:KXZ50679.1 hypothetical protein GPECTOR_15g363 [Gonium pectorale]